MGFSFVPFYIFDMFLSLYVLNSNALWIESNHAYLFPAHLNYLMEENDDCMILPDEYIAMYEKPFDVTLESGR